MDYSKGRKSRPTFRPCVYIQLQAGTILGRKLLDTTILVGRHLDIRRWRLEIVSERRGAQR